MIKVSSKLGRPTDEIKDYNMRIRLSATHKKKLDEIGEKTGQTKANIIREGIDLVFDKVKGK